MKFGLVAGVCVFYETLAVLLFSLTVAVVTPTHHRKPTVQLHCRSRSLQAWHHSIQCIKSLPLLIVWPRDLHADAECTHTHTHTHKCSWRKLSNPRHVWVSKQKPVLFADGGLASAHVCCMLTCSDVGYTRLWTPGSRGVINTRAPSCHKKKHGLRREAPS